MTVVEIYAKADKNPNLDAVNRMFSFIREQVVEGAVDEEM